MTLLKSLTTKSHGGGVSLLSLVFALALAFSFNPVSVFAEATGQNSPGVGGPENIIVGIDANMIPIYWDGNPNGDT
ncbi:MAG: hypothetical protein LBL08_03780, partial [Candidatus Nomurabacteria bacterium]|nr:hypothetical protein [Candidatus Nomurabacteria bacterium]